MFCVVVMERLGSGRHSQVAYEIKRKAADENVSQ